MSRPGTILGLLAVFTCQFIPAQRLPVNYDEGKAGAYTLPNPLVSADGKPVRDAAMWRKARPEILRLFEENIYGRSPGRPRAMTFEVFEHATPALDGKALRKQVRVRFTGKPSDPGMDLLLVQAFPRHDRLRRGRVDQDIPSPSYRPGAERQTDSLSRPPHQ